MIEDIAEFAGFDSALDGLRRAGVAVVLRPVGINIGESDETGIMEGAKSAEDGLIGPSVFLLDGGCEKRGGNPWIEVAFFTEEEAENLDGLVVEVGGDLVGIHRLRSLSIEECLLTGVTGCITSIIVGNRNGP